MKIYNFTRKNILFFIFFCVILLFPIYIVYSQIETEPVLSFSYLGINLGMSREQIIESSTGNFVSTYARMLELDSYSSFGYLGSFDETLIKAKAVPFINRLYFQFIRDPRTNENKLYSILIHFNENHIDYFELLDILRNGLEFENPDFDYSLPESDTNRRMLKFKSYGEPSIVEPDRVVWGIDDDSKVRIILNRSNKINQFGNVVKFIHKEGFQLVMGINNPRGGIDLSSIEFEELIPESSPTPLYMPNILGRRNYFLSALLPQEIK